MVAEGVVRSVEGDAGDNRLARIKGQMKRVSDGVFAVVYIHSIKC